MIKEFYFALATLIGTIIGVGMFGIPFVFSRAGIGLGFFYLALVAIILTIIHLMYGEIILRTKGNFRLPGYAEKYLGMKWKKIIGFSNIFGFYGTLIAYLIVGGEFLKIILSPFLGGESQIYSILFFIIGSYFIFRDVRPIAKTEFYLNIFLLLAIFLISGFAFSKFNILNIKPIDWNNFFLPYGVILFALAGSSAIPELKDVVRANLSSLKKIIIIGTLIPAIIYGIFALAVVGMSGVNTSEEAIAGLTGYLGNKIVFLGALAGFLAVFTSFLVIGLNLKKVFWYDYNIRKNFAWVLAVFVPLVLFLLGIKNFILIIGMVGALLGGFEGIVMIFIYLKSKQKGDRQPEYSINIPRILAYLLALIFVFGIVYQIIYL